MQIDRCLIEDFAKDLSLLENKSPRTIKNYTHVAETFSIFLKKKDIQQGDLRKFLRKNSNRIDPHTQSLWISALKKLFQWLEQKHSFEYAYQKELHSPKRTKKLIKIFELDDLPMLEKYIAKRSSKEKLLFELLYGCALRFSECLNLKKSDCNFSMNYIEVIGKGQKKRRIPMRSQLKKLLKETEDDSIWGTTTSEFELRAIIKKWSSDLGFDEKYGHLHPHKLRHSIASHLLKNGAPLPQIQKVLGHERLATTEKYTHLNIDDILRCYDTHLPDDLK